jgi:hypothetical protein
LRKFTLSDIKPIEDYELTRRAFQSFVDHLWRDRCVPVGPLVKLVFENRQTVLFQVQEALRAANIREVPLIQAELDGYNQLLPCRRQLLAVMLFDVDDLASRRRALEALPEIDRSVTRKIGDRHAVRPEVESVERSVFGGRAIRVLRFAPTSAQVQALRDLRVEAGVSIDHPSYTHAVRLGMETRRSLLCDLGSRFRRRAKGDRLDDPAAEALELSLPGRSARAPEGRS